MTSPKTSGLVLQPESHHINSCQQVPTPRDTLFSSFSFQYRVVTSVAVRADGGDTRVQGGLLHLDVAAVTLGNVTEGPGENLQ